MQCMIRIPQFSSNCTEKGCQCEKIQLHLKEFGELVLFGVVKPSIVAYRYSNVGDRMCRIHGLVFHNLGNEVATYFFYISL